MAATREQKFILFALGLCYAEFSKRFSGKPLSMSISKSQFIELAMKASITKKKERALYKNLETLEKKKLVSYASKNLALTERGTRLFTKISTELSPYLSVNSILTSQDILRYTRKAQAVLALR